MTISLKYVQKQGNSLYRQFYGDSTTTTLEHRTSHKYIHTWNTPPSLYGTPKMLKSLNQSQQRMILIECPLCEGIQTHSSRLCCCSAVSWCGLQFLSVPTVSCCFYSSSVFPVFLLFLMFSCCSSVFLLFLRNPSVS